MQSAMEAKRVPLDLSIYTEERKHERTSTLPHQYSLYTSIKSNTRTTRQRTYRVENAVSIGGRGRGMKREEGRRKGRGRRSVIICMSRNSVAFRTK